MTLFEDVIFGLSSCTKPDTLFGQVRLLHRRHRGLGLWFCHLYLKPSFSGALRRYVWPTNNFQADLVRQVVYSAWVSLPRVRCAATFDCTTNRNTKNDLLARRQVSLLFMAPSSEIRLDYAASTPVPWVYSDMYHMWGNCPGSES
jgi:hypothetical protein